MNSRAEDARTPVVDCDVHPLIKDIHALAPYFTEAWRQYFLSSALCGKSDNGFVYARARDRYPHPNATFRRDALPPQGGPAGSDPAFTVTNHIEPFGIRTAVLLPQEPYGVVRFGNSQAAAAFERANNEYLIDTWLSYDKRYTLAITVSDHDPKSAAADIRRLGSKPGVIGVQVLINKNMLGSTVFDPIYDAASEMELAIISHQSGSEGCYAYSQVPAAGTPRFYGERHAVLPQIGAANVTDMVMSGVFERFPKLRVVMVEWGFTWLVSLMSRMDYLWERNRQASPYVKRPPSQYIVEHCKFATQPLDEAAKPTELAAMFGIPGLEKMLLFSSDYPHYDTDSPNIILNKIPASIKDRICYQNALEAFGPKVFRH